MPSSSPQPGDVRTSAASRPAAQWMPSTRPSDLRGSVFGTTSFDIPVAESQAPGAHSVFDVCHVGVVLRAVLFVNGVVALAMMFVAASVVSWVSLVAVGSAVALPGVLLWLASACFFKQPLGKLALPAQWAAALALGAASAVFGWTLGSLTGLEMFDVRRWLAPALAGIAMAAAIFQWLHMRAKARLPADTTARLAELQSRIRPHFLFNTLNTALSLVRVDPARAEVVLEDLAELFRVALADTDQSVSLGEEVELAQRYLAIEQIRFGNRLQVSWELDADAAAARVPPLLLQPLVENAVRHGVEPAPEGGVIRVRTRVKMRHAVLSIANTVPAAPSRPGNGMALRNVRERLRLMHDVASQFDARLDRNVFRVQIVVPL